VPWLRFDGFLSAGLVIVSTRRSPLSYFLTSRRFVTRLTKPIPNWTDQKTIKRVKGASPIRVQIGRISLTAVDQALSCGPCLGHAELVAPVLGDVTDPGKGLVAALLDDLQVTHLPDPTRGEKEKGKSPRVREIDVILSSQRLFKCHCDA
jgi:hypothetical protein